MPASPAQFDPPFMETKLKPCQPGGRRPLHHEMDDAENFEASPSSPAAPLRQGELAPRAEEECCEISTDEDDSYKSEEEFVPESFSPEQLLSAVRARHASKSLSPRCDYGSQSKKTPGDVDSIGKTASDATNRPKNSQKIEHVSKSVKIPIVIFVIAIFVSVILAVPISSYVWPQEPAEAPKQDRVAEFARDLQEITREFPKQDRRCWLDIRAGMEDLMNTSSKPWTFLLLSNETAAVTRLAELLGEASSKALRAKSSLILKPADMGNEYGDTIDRLLPRILENKAVVVHDLLSIDPGAIQAFHTMCDRENPLVKEAVYIITIIAPGYSSSMRAEAFVENLLLKTFAKGVHEDKLQPLITRLTDGPVIPVV